MTKRVIQFTATTVECSEAIDWEIVQITFSTEGTGLGEADLAALYLVISANFEVCDEVQVEFHDEVGGGGDSLEKIDLWRNRVRVISGSGYEFEIDFALSDDAFAKLREYLRVLLRSDCFRE